MENTIWKFELDTVNMQTIEMPYCAKILTVQVQRETPCLWAIVDPSLEKEKRHFEIFGTGNPIVEGMGVSREYIGTYQLHDGDLVYHVFEYMGI